MDPSALIFVALAVAWAVYLIPKALEHHEESARARTVERFSKTMRVLARREPVSRRKARLVASGASGAATPSPERTRSRPAPEPVPPTPAQVRARRVASARAARRRLRVVTLLLAANAVVAALAWLRVLAWPWCAVPVGVLAVWLVACRLMVRRERTLLPRARRTSGVAPEATPGATDAARAPQSGREPTPVGGGETPSTPERAPDAWDPVYAPLPTYVTKPVAPRTVSTIDLDSTGVWSSGRSAADSALARAAESADHSAAAQAAEPRAFGA